MLLIVFSFVVVVDLIAIQYRRFKNLSTTKEGETEAPPSLL
jgi:hypothetical protein